jgi:GT2 family glycosyltransferase
MDVSIITVTWNSAEFIAEQIKSVQKACTTIKYEHIIIDNASSDKTVEIIEKNFPHIQLIKNSVNCGFAKANNQGARKAQGKFFLFLNPDMKLEEKSLDVVPDFFSDHPQVGIAGCKLVNIEKRMRSIHKPTKFPHLLSLMIIALKISVLFPKVWDYFTYPDRELLSERSVDVVRGSFMLMRREIFDTLGFAFDERYYIWFEDVDICREVRKLGYQVLYTPLISCTDYAGQSFKKQNLLQRQKQFFTSAIIYLQKWEPRYKSVILSVVKWLGIGMVWMYTKIGTPLHMKDAIER